MTLEVLQRELKSRGVLLRLVEGELRYCARRGRMTADLAQALAAHKGALLESLRQGRAVGADGGTADEASRLRRAGGVAGPGGVAGLDSVERVAADWAWLAGQVAREGRRLIDPATGQAERVEVSVAAGVDVDNTSAIWSGAGVMSTAGPCDWCGGALFWRAGGGWPRCQACDPPGSWTRVAWRLVVVRRGKAWDWEAVGL